MEYRPASEIYRAPMHPYTRLLMESVPNIRGRKRALRFIPGAPPNLLAPPLGCSFHPRCPYAVETCTKEEPSMMLVHREYSVACHRVDELAADWYE